MNKFFVRICISTNAVTGNGIGRAFLLAWDCNQLINHERAQFRTNVDQTVCCDAQVMLGLVASATGTAGGVAYIGLKGNSHVKWDKVCDLHDKFCQHLAASIVVSLLAAFVLIFLIALSIFSLHKKIPK